MIKEIYKTSYGRKAVCVCDYCGKEYTKRYSDVDHHKNHFCGNICYRKNEAKKLNTYCAYCGKKIYKKPNQILRNKNSFCNSKCHYDYIKGGNNPNFGKGLFGRKNGRWINAQSPENIRKRRNEPKNRIKHRILSAIRRGLEDGKSGKTITEIFYPEYIPDLIAHLESQFKLGMSWQNMDKWHIDHKKPLSKFNFTSYEDKEFKECWALENLQPLWAEENLKKYNKYIG